MKQLDELRGADGGTDNSERQSELVQLLTPEGKRVEHPDYSLDITPEELRGLYRDMVLTRRFDAEAVTLQRQGELRLWASLLGQEAAQIGSGRAAHKDDYIFPCYREHGVAWTRGVDLLELMSMFRGVNNGGWDPNDKNFHLYTIVIGPPLLHAAGYAMGITKEGGRTAVLSYFGDGASSQGDVAEAFTFASVNNAPVVYFCQNNQWAISTPTAKQTRIPLSRRSDGWGFPGVRVDGNDVLACLAVTRSALDLARSGRGPMLVEALTYRMAPHATSDDPSRYQDKAEREAWAIKDPISRLKTYLSTSEFADEVFYGDVEQEGEELAKQIRDGVRAMSNPSKEELFRHVYAEPHAQVQEEQAEFAAFQASLERGD